jgi:hypothetical protein
MEIPATPHEVLTVPVTVPGGDSTLEHPAEIPSDSAGVRAVASDPQ